MTMSSPPARGPAAGGRPALAAAASSRRSAGVRAAHLHACLLGASMSKRAPSADQLRNGHRWKKRRMRRHTSASPCGSNTRKPTISAPNTTVRTGERNTVHLVAAGQQVEHQLEQLRHHGHEDRAQDAAQDGAHAADDDGGQEEDRHQQRKALGRDHAEEVGPQAAGHAGVERRQAERQQLVAQQRNAQHLGRDVAVADGDEGAAHAGAEQVGRAQQHQQRDRHDQPVEAERGVQRQAEDASPAAATARRCRR